MTYLIVGGLGNQMFQYAAARAISVKTGKRIVVDKQAILRDPLREYELNKYNVPTTDKGFELKIQRLWFVIKTKFPQISKLDCILGIVNEKEDYVYQKLEKARYINGY